MEKLFNDVSDVIGYFTLHYYKEPIENMYPALAKILVSADINKPEDQEKFIKIVLSYWTVKYTYMDWKSMRDDIQKLYEFSEEDLALAFYENGFLFCDTLKNYKGFLKKLADIVDSFFKAI